MIQTYLNVLKNHYADFNGRARRRDYWTFVLGFIAIMVVFNILTLVLGRIPVVGTIVSLAGALVALAHLVPTIAAGVRRMHDIGKPGWFIVLSFIPLVNFYYIYLAVQDSQAGENEHGANPKA